MADAAGLLLDGRTVVVTRPEHQVADFSRLLAARGAQPIEVPMTRLVDAGDGGAALTDAVARLDDYDWVILTSPNGAERFVQALESGNRIEGVQIAAVGPATAAVLTRARIPVGLVPERFVAEGLLDVFPGAPSGGGAVLLPRAADARAALPEGLRARGWRVDDVAAYRNVALSPTSRDLAAIAAADVITFTASSAVQSFVEQVGLSGLPPTVACIGPATTATALELGMSVAVEAETHTLEGLVAALGRFYLAEGGSGGAD